MISMGNVYYGDKMQSDPIYIPSNNDEDAIKCEFLSESVNSEIKNSTVSEIHQSIIEPYASLFKYCKCHCGRFFLQMSDYREHITHQHKLVLKYFEFECHDREAFELFKVNCRFEHGLRFVEEEGLDGTKRLIFKCDEYVDKSGTCPSQLNVYDKRSGWLISGFITHGNHDIRPEPQPSSSNIATEMPSTSKVASASPKIVNTKLLKIFDVVKPIEEVKKRPATKIATKSAVIQKTKPKLSLDLFNL